MIKRSTIATVEFVSNSGTTTSHNMEVLTDMPLGALIDLCRTLCANLHARKFRILVNNLTGRWHYV